MLSNPANYLNAHLYSVCQRMDKVVLNTKNLPYTLFKYGPKSIFLPKLSFEGQLDEIDKQTVVSTAHDSGCPRDAWQDNFSISDPGS